MYQVIAHEELDVNARRSTTVLQEPPRFDDDEGGYGGNWLTIVLNGDHTVRTVRHAPDFSTARSVIGLDTHPNAPLWQRNVHPGMDTDHIMTPDERRLWRRLKRGLTVVQVGDATRPLSGSSAHEWFENDQRFDVLLKELHDHYGSEFDTAITTA